MKEYEISKCGPERSLIYGPGQSQPGLAELVSWTAGEPFQKATFAVYCPTTWHIRQGDSGVTVHTAMSTSIFVFPRNLVWRIDVDKPSERYVAIAGGGEAGTAYVKKISDLVDNFGTFTPYGGGI